MAPNEVCNNDNSDNDNDMTTEMNGSSKQSWYRSKRVRKWRQRAKKAVGTFALAWSILMPVRPALARKADFDSSARANDILMQSIQPGMTATEAEKAMNGETVSYERDLEHMEGVSSAATEEEDDDFGDELKNDKKNKKKKKANNKKQKQKDLYADLDFDDDDDVLMDEVEEVEVAKESARTTATAASKGFYSSEVSRSMYRGPIILFAGVPITVCVGREMYKKKQEAAYVQKALKIAESQRAEYERSKKNTTDVGNNSTAVDEEDDNEEEDGEDSEDGSKDKDGDGQGGDGSGTDSDDDDYLVFDDDEFGGDGEDGEDDGPTQEDIDRLNKLMGR